MQSTLITEKTYYASVFFRDGKYSDNPERCTLLIRRYRVTEGPSGRRHLKTTTDAKVWPDEAAMASDLEHLDWQELPDEADGNPRFVPDEIAALLKRSPELSPTSAGARDG